MKSSTGWVILSIFLISNLDSLNILTFYCSRPIFHFGSFWPVEIHENYSHKTNTASRICAVVLKFDTGAVIALCPSSHSFESNIFCDQPLLSISNCPPKEDSDVHDKPPGLCAADSSNALWLNDSVFEPAGTSGASEQLFRETDLTKELLNQQCGELRQALSIKDHDLNVLREEVCKTTEELEEARSR